MKIKFGDIKEEKFGARGTEERHVKGCEIEGDSSDVLKVAEELLKSFGFKKKLF